MPEGSGQSGSTSRFTAAGSAAAVVAVLGILVGQLDVLNLRPWVLALVTLLLASLALLPGALSAQRTQRADDATREERLDEALACWPPRITDELSAYDAGVHPSLTADGEPGPYLPRPDVDVPLSEALRDVPIVVAIGPTGSGKSRSAFEAVGSAMPDALLLIPKDADGLRAVLRLMPEMHLGGSDVVVWLDGLERFATGLDGELLFRFLERAPRRRRRDRILRRPAPPAPRTRVVATIRTSALTALLDPAGDGDLGLRRLVARARGIDVPARMDPVAPANWRAGWGAPRTSGAPATAPSGSRRYRLRRRTIAVAPVGVGLLVAGAAVALVVVVWILDFGWTQPRKVHEQVADLIKRENCPTAAYPAKGKDLADNAKDTQDTLVLVVQGEPCGRSDTLKFFRLRNGRLKQVATLSLPAGASRQAFRCLGPDGSGRSDPCHTQIEGRTFVVGAFVDAESQQQLPVAVSFEPGLRVWALSPPPGAVRKAPRMSRASARVRGKLALQVNGNPPATGDCVASSACVRGRRAAVTAVVPAADGMPATLVLGYPAQGSIDAPRKHALQVWALAAGTDGVPAVDRHRDCIVLRDGLVQRLTVPGTADGDRLPRQWDSRKRRPLMC